MIRFQGTCRKSFRKILLQTGKALQVAFHNIEFNNEFFSRPYCGRDGWLYTNFFIFVKKGRRNKKQQDRREGEYCFDHMNELCINVIHHTIPENGKLLLLNRVIQLHLLKNRRAKRVIKSLVSAGNVNRIR